MYRNIGRKRKETKKERKNGRKNKMTEDNCIIGYPKKSGMGSKSAPIFLSSF